MEEPDVGDNSNNCESSRIGRLNCFVDVGSKQDQSERCKLQLSSRYDFPHWSNTTMTISSCHMDQSISIAMDRSIGNILVRSWIDP